MRLPLLILHILAGTVGLLSGTLAIAVRKGGRLHRASGNIFTVAMLALASSALCLAIMKSQHGNIVGSIITFYMISTAWLAGRRRAIGRLDLAALVVGLGGAAAIITLGVWTLHHPDRNAPVAMCLFMAAILLLAAAGDIRMLARGGISGRPRVTRHLWRMCFGLFIATGSFFLGQQQVFPAFLRGSIFLTVLALLPFPLMIYWLVRVRFSNASYSRWLSGAAFDRQKSSSDITFQGKPQGKLALQVLALFFFRTKTSWAYTFPMLKTADSPSIRRLTSLLPAGVLFLTFHAVAQTSRSIAPPPVAPVRPVTDTYFGQQVIDPYRYLEDQKSPEVVAFMRGQADYTRAVLDSIPGRQAFAAEMSRYMNAEEAAITDVKVAGPYLFYRKRKRDENQASLYVRMASGGPERMLLDLPKLSTATSHVSLDDYTPSDDGKFVTADLSPGGSEVKTAHIYETATGRELPETIERCEGAVFSADDKSLFYLQLEKLAPNAPPTDKFRKPMVRQHFLGTPVAKDALVLGRGISPDIEVPEFSFPIALTVPGSRFAFAIVTPGVDPDSSIYVGPQSALTTHTGWQKVADFSDKVTDEALHGDNLYLVSFDGTLNGRILRVDAAHPNLKAAEVVLPESDLVLSGGFIGTNVLHAASDALYIQCLQNGIGRVLRLPYGPIPKPTPLPLPGSEHADAVATAFSVSGAVIDLTSWTMPGDDFRYDSKTASLTALHLKLPNSVDPTDLVSEEVTIKGLDGTPLPLSIVYKKGLVRDGSAPTALIGYGAYGDAMTPGFGRRYMAWLERGGVLAIAHVRGGGELGEGWHLAGKKLTKANTWRDFIASAQYLIDSKYTSTPHLGIWSQSAGGILIGRSITERPDLFAAAVDGVPCSDMLREETGANGPANIPEFGSVKDPDGFKALFEMAAYEHIVPGTKYPATLVTAGANDPRVDPWEGAKMASRLQAANAGPNPILFRVNYDAGHGITDTIVQQISDWTDIFTFFLWNFGYPDFQPAVLARSTKAAAYSFGDQPYPQGER